MERNIFCGHCGARLPKGSLFCRHCGEKVEKLTETNNIPPSIPASNDFITLKCPSCGGALKITADVETLKCQFCGAEHIIRRENNGVTFEAFARCPTCRRNDKTVKASLKFGHQSVEPKFNMIQNIKMRSGSWILFVIGIVSILGSFSEKTFGMVFMLCIVGVLLIFLAFYPRYRQNKKIDLANLITHQNYVNAMQLYKENMDHWEHVYYCERDDTFFDIQENKIVTKQTILNEWFPGWNLNN